MVKLQDVLAHKISECDRRIQAEIEQIELDLEQIKAIKAKIKVGSDVYINFAVRTPRLQELLTERTTLRAVLADASKVEKQQ